MSTEFIKPTKRNYLPSDEDHAFDWLVNFKTELPRFAAIFNIGATQSQQLVNTTTVYEHTREYAANAADVYHERIANKNQAAWNPLGTELIIRPFTARLNLASNEIAGAGALTCAVTIADIILKSPACTSEVKDALRLNNLPKHQTVGKPEFRVFIENNQLVIVFVKGEFEYLIARIDHGTGAFDKEYTVLHSPWHDPHPLPEDESQIWNVQLIGFLKGDPVGIPGDTIVVGAKAYTAKHSEGAN
ncbi:MAG: hypothetical protein LBK60_01370 [Verrucomicrobiales bacterium]|jgi:hypothetical protein|nr:hypothetical protein [Verrucomicrobiales bacterium]